jgi:hypothetical protein
MGVAGHIDHAIVGLYSSQWHGDSNTGFLSIRNDLGFPVQPVPQTSIGIPARTLASGLIYRCGVRFDTFTALDSASQPGTGAIARFSKTLRFYIATPTSVRSPTFDDPSPPVILSQPADAIGVLGGSARISLAAEFNGVSNPYAGLLWFHDGQPIELDGVKYSLPVTAPLTSRTFDLVVKNLTAADAGTYSATLVTSTGLVASRAATLTLAPPVAPVIARQAAPLTVASGASAVFTVAATGTPAPTYQWLFNDQPIAGPGNNTSTLWLRNVTAAAAGNYRCRVDNGVGAPVLSTAATLTVQPTTNPGRLINLSIFAPLTAGESMSMGTVLGGAGTSGPKAILARVGGPSLTAFGITAFLPDPKMTLVATGATNTTIAANDNWGGDATLTNAFNQVGAFAFLNGATKDAAIFQPALAPGNYAVQLSDAGTGAGTTLAEIYDATSSATYTAATPRLINVSVIKQIATGTSLSAGFVIGGDTAKTVLVRAIGPGLTAFGVASPMPDPRLSVVQAGATLAQNDNWGGDQQLVAASNSVGAFGITNAASTDAMLLITLPPGNYSAVASPAATGGSALVEVYDVP